MRGRFLTTTCLNRTESNYDRRLCVQCYYSASTLTARRRRARYRHGSPVPSIQGQFRHIRHSWSHPLQSKRHSRNLSTLSSAPQTPLSTSPPPRPASSASFTSLVTEPENYSNGKPNGPAQRPRALSMGPEPDAVRRDPGFLSTEPSSPPTPPSSISPPIISAPVARAGLPNGHGLPSTASSAAAVEIEKPPPTRKTSTFRRVPLRDPRPSLPASPLRSSHLQPPTPSNPPPSSLRTVESGSPAPSLATRTNSQPLTPEPRSPAESAPTLLPPKPPPKPSSSTPPTPRTPSQQSPPPTPAVSTPRPTTRFYRPGFQPKGVYRPRTEQFAEARKSKRDNGRIETTRLERRLEKLINLHFPDVPEKPTKPPPMRERRASSFFEIDFSDLKNKSAGDLWKGVLQSQAPGGKGDVRGK